VLVGAILLRLTLLRSGKDEHGNVANDLCDAGATLGESYLFLLTASALNRKSSSGDRLGSALCGEEARGREQRIHFFSLGGGRRLSQAGPRDASFKQLLHLSGP